MQELVHLWRGELPLLRVFWGYAIAGGLIVNLVTSGLFLTFLTMDRVILAFLVGYGVSLPYNALALIGLWRATRRGQPPPVEGPFLFAVALVLMVVLSVT